MRQFVQILLSIRANKLAEKKTLKTCYTITEAITTINSFKKETYKKYIKCI